MLKRISLVMAILAAIYLPLLGCEGGSGVASTGTGGGGDLTPAEIAQYEDSVFTIVNQERASYGKAALMRDPELDAIAKAHSVHMESVGIMAHDGIGDGTMVDRYNDAGYTYTAAGENVAKGQPTAAIVMDAWMGSTGHRENILSTAYDRIGIGLAMPGYYWTQNFARK